MHRCSRTVVWGAAAAAAAAVLWRKESLAHTLSVLACSDVLAAVIALQSLSRDTLGSCGYLAMNARSDVRKGGRMFPLACADVRFMRAVEGGNGIALDPLNCCKRDTKLLPTVEMKRARLA
nr:hypothetical protein CFP56_37373 [Quercus suber]